MSKINTVSLDHRELLSETLKDKFHYFILGVFVLIFALIGAVSFAQKGIPEVVKNTVQVQNQPQLKLATQTSVISQKPATYTIKEGDTLSSIAQALFGSEDKALELASLNNIENPDLIYAGQVLNLKSLPSSETIVNINEKGDITPHAASTGKVTQRESQYTIQDGDTLWTIAQNSYGDPNAWIKIAQTNNLSDPNIIYSGVTIVIPRG